MASAVVLSAWIVQGSAHAERRSSAKTLSRSLADLPRLASVTTVADVGEAINSFRLAEKLGQLVVDPILSETAQNWSSVLSAGGSVYHDPQLVAGYADGWQTLSESVAEGGTADEALATVFANRTQATEIVRTTTTGMGIGLTTKDGRAYLVVRFVG